jgi:hypothetical protein
MKDQILGFLRSVEGERRARDHDVDLSTRVGLLKRYQQRRFELTYADLLQSSRHGKASSFFLAELYGPMDFRDRDAQFSRIVPKLVRAFPADVVATVGQLAQLHALSEQLDTQMARCLRVDSVNRAAYVQAWQSVGQEQQRQLQLQLVLSIGKALNRFTEHAWLLTALRMMRGPAKAANLSELQRFLEAGVESFRTMGGADEFLYIVASREQELIDQLFAARPPAVDTDRDDSWLTGVPRILDFPPTA